MLYEVITDWDLLPDLHRLIEALDESFEELVRAAGGASELMQKARGGKTKSDESAAGPA